MAITLNCLEKRIADIKESVISNKREKNPDFLCQFRKRIFERKRDRYIEDVEKIFNRLIDQLRKSYAIFGRGKYLENFFRTFEESLKRYGHFDTICWSIFGGSLAASFAFVGLIIVNMEKIIGINGNLTFKWNWLDSSGNLLLIIIPLLLAWGISVLGFFSYMKVYEIARNTRKYIFLVEEIFGFYFLSYTEKFLEGNLIPNTDSLKIALEYSFAKRFSIRFLLVLFEIIYFIAVLVIAGLFILKN